MSVSKIPLAGVIGCPVAHSKSPRLHGHWLSTYGIDGHYVPLHVEPQNLEAVLRQMSHMGFVGANVTIPHKEAVIAIADQVTDRATVIGAANTLTFLPDGKIIADNTDGYGFITNLTEGAPDWEPTSGPAVVLGAGGACRAVIASLIEAGVNDIILTNRTRDRAEQLRSDFGQKVRVVDWVKAPNVLEEGKLIVNTTSLGMTGKSKLRIPLDGIPKEAVVTDLIYTPLQTDLLGYAQSIGCKTVDGLGMLIHQAVPGFERWFGVRPDITDQTRAMILG